MGFLGRASVFEFLLLVLKAFNLQCRLMVLNTSSSIGQNIFWLPDSLGCPETEAQEVVLSPKTLPLPQSTKSSSQLPAVLNHLQTSSPTSNYLLPVTYNFHLPCYFHLLQLSPSPLACAMSAWLFNLIQHCNTVKSWPGSCTAPPCLSIQAKHSTQYMSQSFCQWPLGTTPSFSCIALICLEINCSWLICTTGLPCLLSYNCPFSLTLWWAAWIHSIQDKISAY